ncbi:MAG: DUF1684 domain-containing protein [Roseiarcus sp.]
MISGPTAAGLVEWRESVAAIYRDVRETHDADPGAAWLRFREQRDRLYKRHPCSALTDEEKRSFAGFAYHEYDPYLCIVGEIDYAVAEFSLDIEVSEGTLHCRRIGVARFSHARQRASLDLFWLDIYGGGLWLPVGDQTNGTTTYRGGRYLYDTAKGANLGLNAEGSRILLDFNFLYPPSCALSDSWICPLCPPANRLPFKLEAGERSRSA